MQANETVVRNGRRWAALLCCVAAVALVGCTLTPGADPCSVAGVCDDEDACTVDTCVNSNGVADCTNTPVVCSNGFLCDPADGECVECVEDADCDDGDLCNGDETCVANACVAGTPVTCDIGECDPATGECPECVDDADCPDDGLFCTGDPLCTDGACGFSGDPCAAGETCDEDADTCSVPAPECVDDADCGTGEICSDGVCVAGPTTCTTDDDCGNLQICDTSGLCQDVECTVDADCDDDLFCNGAETCDTTGFTCVAGTDPCAADETCDEDTDACETTPSQTFILTTGTDVFTGGSGDDLFLGDLDFSAGGAGVQTLGVNDQLTGGTGTDELRATISAAVTPSSLAGIEIIQITNTAAVDPTLTNAPDVTTVKTTGNTNAIAFNSIQNAVGDFSVTNNAQNVTFNVTSTKLSGTSDVCTLGVSSVTGGTVVIQPSAAGSGYETLTVISSGGAINQFMVNDGNGNSLASLVVSGSQDLDINGAALDTTITSVNASAATGDVDVLVPGDGVAGTAITVTGGAGDDDLDCTDTADENFTVNGGAGDDKITFNANYDSTSPFTDTVDGGAGTDELVVVSADAVTTTTQSNVSNIETLTVSDALAGNLTPANWGSITEVKLAGGIDGTARTITFGASGATLNMDADAGAANHVVVVSGTGTSDTLTLDLASGVDFGANLAVNGVETLTIKTATTAGTLNDIVGTLVMTPTAGGSSTIVITGAQEVEFSGAVTAGVINGSAATGVIDMQATTANAASITGGSAADTLAGSDGNDVISGGAGADIIDGNDGDDTLTGGSGADTFRFTAGDQSAAPSATVFSAITDFEKDTDIFDESAGALVIVSGSAAASGTAAVSAEGICTFHSDDDTLAERIVACEAGINASGLAAARQFAVFAHSTNSYLFVSDGVDGIAAADVLFQLTGVTGLTDTTLTAGDLTIK